MKNRYDPPRELHRVGICLAAILLLFFIQAPVLSAQSPQLDSLKDVLTTAVDTHRVEVLNLLGQRSISYDKDQALTYINEAMELSKRLDYPRGVAHAYHSLGVEAARRGAYDTALVFAERSLSISKSIPDEQLMGLTWNAIGGIHSFQGRYLEARKAFMESEKIKADRGDIQGQIVTVYNLVALAVKLKSYQEAEQLYDKIKRLSDQERKGKSFEFYYNYGRGEVALAQKQFRRAQGYLEKAYELQKTQKVSNRVKAVLKGYLGQAGVGLGQFERALIWLEAAVSELQALGEQEAVGENYLTIAEAYQQKEEISKAIWAAEQAYELAADIDDLDLLNDVTLKLAELYRLGNLSRQSNEFYQTHLLYRDSVFNVEKTKEISRLEAFYENAQKEQEIIRLTQENDIKELKTQNQRAWLWTIGIALFLLLILAGVLYRGNQLKTRTNHLLSAQKQEIESHNQAITAQNALISTQKSALEKTLSEKEMLMREIHHRAKNNLSIIESLLNMQTRQLENSDARSALQESRSRVQAIGLIHQQLYGSHHNTSVNVKEYLLALGDKIRHSLLPHNIALRQEVAPVELNVEKLVPLGLLINEAVTNSVKYAFPDGRPGTIQLYLSQNDDHQLRLSVSDNGIGFHNGPNYGQPRKNFQLIRGLARQLHGELDIANQKGTTVRLTFANRNRFEQFQLEKA